MRTINKILKETCQAPSSCNSQPWHFIVINNKEVMKKLSDESKKNILQEIKKNPKSEYKRFKKLMADPEYNVFYNAPCLIIVVGEENLSWLCEDSASAVNYLMFSAADKGLGTCWIGLGAKIKNPKLKKEIGLPKGFKIMAPIILGYPKKSPRKILRDDPAVLKIVE